MPGSQPGSSDRLPTDGAVSGVEAAALAKGCSAEAPGVSMPESAAFRLFWRLALGLSGPPPSGPPDARGVASGPPAVAKGEAAGSEGAARLAAAGACATVPPDLQGGGRAAAPGGRPADLLTARAAGAPRCLSAAAAAALT